MDAELRDVADTVHFIPDELVKVFDVAEIIAEFQRIKGQFICRLHRHLAWGRGGGYDVDGKVFAEDRQPLRGGDAESALFAIDRTEYAAFTQCENASGVDPSGRIW